MDMCWVNVISAPLILGVVVRFDAASKIRRVAVDEVVQNSSVGCSKMNNRRHGGRAKLSQSGIRPTFAL